VLPGGWPVLARALWLLSLWEVPPPELLINPVLLASIPGDCRGQKFRTKDTDIKWRQRCHTYFLILFYFIYFYSAKV
jgi:hypothetical protein